jgi:leucyl aminopeptidase
MKAGNETDDLVWELPLHKDFKEKVKSQVADYNNADIGTSHLAGASKGAAFIDAFINKDTVWAHLGIAGTAYTHDPKKYEQKGGTGSSVRLILNMLENY